MGVASAPESHDHESRALILSEREIGTLKKAKEWWHRVGAILTHPNIRVLTSHPTSWDWFWLPSKQLPFSPEAKLRLR